MANSISEGDTFFDGYKVIEKLGSGAFGTVYKVVKHDASGEYTRALKHITIPSSKQQYESVFNSMGGDVSKVDDYFSAMLKSIVSEIQILNDLSEKGVTNIVRYYGHNIATSDSPKQYDIYILMEYLTPLMEHAGSAKLTVRDVIKLGLDVLRALELCHQNGIIHRDIKDENIFVTTKGEYKIGDFGVSKVLKGSNKAESVKGTPNFIAPEVYLKGEGYTQSVDLYSLGIVIYRLLNNNRNPFLPQYPQPFTPDDEDIAFNDRMKGKMPNLPTMGGASIGNVVVKLVSGKAERFASALEFRIALEKAEQDSDETILNTVVNVVLDASGYSLAQQPKSQTFSDGIPKHYYETIKESVGESPKDTVESETSTDSDIHKKLFETVGEKYDPPVPEPITAESGQSVRENRRSALTAPIVDVPPIIEPEMPVSIDNNIIKKIIFLLPIGIALIGIIAYFIIIPNIYSKVVSFIDWLFTDPQNIVDTLKNPNAVLPQVHSIIGIRIFWYVWLAGFIASLFFVGRQLQRKPEPNAVNALMTRKEPYLSIQDISSDLKLLKQRRSGKELDALIYAVKKLEEKLSVESDFGYGKGAIIECENNIARQLQFLNDVLPSVETGNFIENIEKMNTAVKNIANLLKRRTELKKR